MTLGDLIRKANKVGYQFDTFDIPIYDEAYIEIQDVQFEVEDDEADGYFIQMTIK